MDIAKVTLQVARKSEMATKALEATQAKAVELAQAGNMSADDWARYANEVAKAEGVAHVWIRLQLTVNYFAKEGMELTDAALLDPILELLGAGADDGWSGRVNDARRARFDGIREAANSAKYLVIA